MEVLHRKHIKGWWVLSFYCLRKCDFWGFDQNAAQWYFWGINRTYKISVGLKGQVEFIKKSILKSMLLHAFPIAFSTIARLRWPYKGYVLVIHRIIIFISTLHEIPCAAFALHADCPHLCGVFSGCFMGCWVYWRNILQLFS